MSDLKIVDVRKAYGKTEILHGIDINIDHAEFVVFVGPSGCGKSTLLRTIAGLEDITSGDLFIGGQRVNELPPSRRGIAMVFQSYALYPHMNVYKNMAFGLRLAKGDRQAIDRKVREAARILQLEPLLKRLPRELSGGQRQRVAIGRAIVRDPNVFLFDEPLSNLDAALRVQTRVEIAKLHQDLKTTIIYVTHDQVEAMTLADKIVVLNEGCVEQIGSPLELYFHPANRFVAGFIGSPAMNFVDVVIADVGDEHVDIRLPDGRVARLHLAGAVARPGHQATLGIRPEHMIEGDAEGIQLGGSVEVVERLGDDSYVYVRQDGGSNLTLRADGHSRIRAGDTVVFSAESDAVHLFDADGKAFTRLGSNPKYNAELIESAAAS